MSAFSGSVYRPGEIVSQGLSGRASFTFENLSLTHPLCAVQDRLAVAVEGEGTIDNAEELDAQSVLRAYEAFGVDSFHRFKGRFAIAIADARGRRPVLHLLRDRWGLQPLYYSVRDGRLAFSSAIRPMLEAPWVQRRVRSESLFHYLSYGHVPSPVTLIEGVRQLRPGAWLRFENSMPEERLTWHPVQLLGKEDPVPGGPEWEEGLESALEAAIARALARNPKRVGCLMDGSPGSRILATLAPSPLERFSWGDLPLTGSAFADAMLETIRSLEQPVSDSKVLSDRLMTRHFGASVDVTLSAEGASPLFVGEPEQRELLKKAWRRRGAFGWAARAFGHTRSESEILESLLRPPGAERVPSLVSHDEKSPYFAVTRDLAELSLEERASQLPLTTTWVDRISGLATPGLRFPFLDDEFVEFSSWVPFRNKYHRGVSELLLKRFVQDREPSSGTVMPPSFRESFRDGLRALLLDYLGAERLKRSDEFREPAAIQLITRVIQEHDQGTVDHSRVLGSLLAFEIWKESLGLNQ